MTDYQLAHGDCRAVLACMADCSIDAVVTDPPYELGMSGSAWDSTGIAYSVPLWREVLRVLKPGGHLLSFGGTRTSHRMVCAVEDAGFRIRDSIAWINATGYAKSLDVGKAFEKANGVEPVGERPASLGMVQRADWNACNRQLVMPEAQTDEGREWDGFGTQLKPFVEPVALCQRPLSEPTFVENVRRWGVGALNLDACRLQPDAGSGRKRKGEATAEQRYDGAIGLAVTPGVRGGSAKGRRPSNVIFDEEAIEGLPPECRRFYYCAKASTAERDAGLAEAGIAPWFAKNDPEKKRPRYNPHLSVKPLSLMRYLVKLSCPPGATVLDIFAGSGSTGVACMHEGFAFAGIEQDAGYLEVARARIEHAKAFK